ncbi:UNVERIFIED_CONTAM: hypothetical protein K2H54_064574 [Gekko kuhli]
MDEWREVFRQRMREAKPGDAWSLGAEERLEASNLEPGWKKARQEHARASFLCSQCYHTWFSYQVMILFHMCWERPLRQGWVRMRLFRQQCHRCSSARQEEPQFTREEMENVVQCLVLDIREKCYREGVHRPELLEVVIEGRGPHKSECCEACQMGLHKGHHGKPDGALHHGKPDGALHHGKPDSALHHGKPGGALHHGTPGGALHHGTPGGALHHGTPGGALHHGKPDSAWHHGKAGSALYSGSSQSPRYSCTPNLPSYEISPVHTSGRRSLVQLPSLSRRCCVCGTVISAACVVLVIFVLVAYWNGWFWG